MLTVMNLQCTHASPDIAHGYVDALAGPAHGTHRPQHLWIMGLKTSAPVGPGISAQPGLYYRGVFRPLVLSWVGGTARGNY